LIKQNKLIYITNTRVPSERANTYQTMQMCSVFSEQFDSLELWVPDGINTKEMTGLDPFVFYNIKQNFDIVKIQVIDSWWLHNFSKIIWSYIRGITFAFSVVLKLILFKRREDHIVFTRDWRVLKVLSFLKRLNLFNKRCYFEAHKYSEHLVKNIRNITTGLIVINGYLFDLFSERDIKNICLAHDGVNLDEYAYFEPYVYVKKKEFNIVYTGSLFEWKGVYTLIDSMKFIRTPNVYLKIIGGPDNEIVKKTEKYIYDNGLQDIIELVGFVPKIKVLDYQRNADIFILPNSCKDKMSYYTSPIKLFEYMAAKRPVIASELPSLCEILKDRHNAVLFEPDNPQSLADAIEFVLKNDCTNIVSQAYKDVQEFSWKKRAQKIVGFIRRAS
jgi:glycosyltransferase involved in cell wall biosynthesis